VLHYRSKPSKLRTAIGCVAGIATFLTLFFGLLYLLRALGLPIDYEHAPVAVVGESDGGWMGYAWAAAGVNVMIAFRVGAFVTIGRLDADLSLREQVTFNTWLFSLASFSILAGVIHLVAMNAGQFAGNALTLFAAAAVAAAFANWREQRLWELYGVDPDDR